MAEALLFGIIASSALVLGALLGAVWKAPTTATGVMLAFASGSLISALAFELFPEAYELSGVWRSGFGLLAGGATFVAINTWLDRKTAPKHGGEQADTREVIKESSKGVGFALLAAVTLDGIPENLALGISLVEQISVTLLVAIFASNFPEALVGTIAMRSAGKTKRFAVGVWGTAALVLALFVVFGNAIGNTDENVLGFLLAFAGGAVLSSLADTLMPEAFEHGKPWNSFATAGGFFISFVLSQTV